MRKILTPLRFIIAFAMLISVTCIHAQSRDYGLHIKTYPIPNEQRTTALLDGGEPISLGGKNLTLSFDLRLRHDNVLGTVVRIITDNGKNVDLLYSIENDERYPNLVTGDKANLQTTLPPYDKWVPVSMELSPKSGNVKLDYNGTVTTASYPDLKGAKSVRIAFGLCSIEGFVLNDQASVDIKDVALYKGKEKIRYWQLKAHLDGSCLDEIHNMPMTVSNPEWIADETAKWRLISEQKFKSQPSVAFDPIIATFYMVSAGSNKLLVFHSSEGVTDSIATQGLPHLSEWPNQLIFIPKQHKLLSYNIDENRYATFDPVNDTWCNGGKTTKDHDFWNNSVSYNPADSTLVSFGGYGHYKFNNLMVTCYPFSNKPQKSIALTEIHPRRSCATAVVANHLYIYGGWGCPSGRQELDTRNYYDLYRVNLANNSVELMWDLEKSPLGEGFTCLENMIYEPESDSFMMLSTFDHGTLLKVKRTTGEMEKMSYPMGIQIDSHFFYGNFYYSQEQNKYYAAVVKSDVEGSSTLSIYELSAPVAPVASLTQTYEKPTAQNGSRIWIYVIIALAIAAIAGLCWYLRSRQQKRKHHHSATADNKSNKEEFSEYQSGNAENTSNPNTAGVNDALDLTTEAEVSDKTDGTSADFNSNNSDSHHSETQEEEEGRDATPDYDTTPRFYDLTRGCVRLFGNFQVLDKDGNDITAQFTPTLKQLLLVMILYTGKNPNGVSGKKLLDIVWPDKESESAKNNRNVYLSRLRPILQQIGDVKVGAVNGFRNITFGEGTMCDYLEFVKLSHSKSEENNERALELLFHGMLLPNVEEDYVDSFKSDFSNEAIDFLTQLLRQKGLSNKQRMKIADTIFEHDFVNEDALKVKCRILHQQGRTGMARSAYNSFCREYNTLMGNPYPHSFNEIISGQ